MRTYNGKDYFYQWDLDQKVTSNGLRVGDEVHFCNMTCVKALITVGYELNGVVVADVPNILLQTSYPVVIYTMDDNGGLITKTEYQFAVKQRPQPSDYVYTETEVKRYADLENKVKELENKIENGDFNGGQIDSEVIAQEVEKYLDENPPAQGSPGKDGKDGEDGEPGRDGVDGKDGKDGKSAYEYAQDGGYTGSEEEFSQKLAEDTIPSPTTAQVGQTIVVKEVDESGKPVSWECADLASGGSGDRWTKLGDVTVQDTYEIVPLSFTGGIVTVDTTTDAYSWMSQYDNVQCVVHPIDITSKKLAPIVGRLRKLDAETGTFEFLNRDSVLQSTASYDPATYKISVDNVASVEMTDIPSYELYKLRMTTPVLTTHGARAFYSSTMTCLSMGAFNTVTASGGIFEVETMRYPADSNYMYKHSRVSYGIWYGGNSTSEAQAFELIDAGVGKTQPPTNGKISFNISTMIFVNGTRFELWGANDD